MGRCRSHFNFNVHDQLLYGFFFTLTEDQIRTSILSAINHHAPAELKNESRDMIIITREKFPGTFVWVCVYALDSLCTHAW